MLVTSELEQFLKDPKSGTSCLCYTFWDESPYLHNAYAHLEYSFLEEEPKFPHMFTVKPYYLDYNDKPCEFFTWSNYFFTFSMESIEVEEITDIIQKKANRFLNAANRMFARLLNYLECHGFPKGEKDLQRINLAGDCPRWDFQKVFTKAWRGGRISVDGCLYFFDQARSYFFLTCIDILSKPSSIDEP